MQITQFMSILRHITCKQISDHLVDAHTCIVQEKFTACCPLSDNHNQLSKNSNYLCYCLLTAGVKAGTDTGLTTEIHHHSKVQN